MEQIRGIKVKPDSEAGTTSNDAHIQTSQPAVPSKSDTDRPKVAARTALKKPTEKPVMKDAVVKEGASTANSNTTAREGSLADQPVSKNAVVSHNLVEDSQPAAVTESNAAASLSLDKPSASGELRTCARCHKQELTLHEFKKCKK